MKISKIYELLHSRYGNLNWWPANSPYEVIVGAVLTQNTNWSNVEKALANFNGIITPEAVEKMPAEALKEIIRPAGFYNQKAVYLKAVTEWYKKYGYDVKKVQQHALAFLRKELLAIKGIGNETADSILLYAFDLPTFVVDKYTCRLLERVGIALPKGYDGVKALFEKELPQDVALFNNYHACIVINAKEHCKVKPVCEGCPLADLCVMCL